MNNKTYTHEEKKSCGMKNKTKQGNTDIDYKGSYVKNCLIRARKTECGPIIRSEGNGKYSVYLDGYAVIPKEEFELMEEELRYYKLCDELKLLERTEETVSLVKREVNELEYQTLLRKKIFRR